MAIEIITTSDGSHSLLNTELNETYHSIHGAIQESSHVFIRNGFDFFLEQSNPENINILEIGFGTGLNALLTVQRALALENKIHYTTLEAFPIELNTWTQLNYTESIGLKDYFEKLHEAEWSSWQTILLNFQLLKLNTTLQNVEFPASSFDAVFFDAFAPNKQPEMWELPMLKKIFDAMNNKGVFVTYSAKGQLKRDLKSLGLDVQTLPGPPGKKEMVRGVKRPD